MQTARLTTLHPMDERLREGRITGSRIVKLYRGEALAVFNEMTGIAPPVEPNDRMQAGIYFEEPTLRWVADERGWRVRHNPGTKVRGRHASTPDAEIFDGEEDADGEVKWRAPDQWLRYQGGQETEDEHVQCLWHQHVTGHRRGYVIVSLGGQKPAVYPVHSAGEEDSIAALCELADRFLVDHIDTGKPPPMDASDAAADYLRAKFPKDTGPVIPADERLEALVRSYRAACEAFDAAEEAKGRTGNLLREAIGDAAGVKGTNFSVSYKASKLQTRTDWQALLMEMVAQIPADLLAKHSTTKPGPRSLRLQWKE